MKIRGNNLIIVLSIVILIGYGIYASISNHSTNYFQINIVVPWGLIAVFVSFYLFKEYNRVKRAKRDERREYMNEHRQDLLNKVVRKNKKSPPKSD